MIKKIFFAIIFIFFVSPVHAQKSADVTKYINDLRTGTPEARMKAADALGKIKDPSAIPALIEVLKREGVNDRICAVKALGDIGDPSAIPALIEELRDMNILVRARADEALGAIGPAAIPALVEVTKDKKADVRYYAVDALGRIRPAATEAVPALIIALKDDDRDVRSAAIHALGVIGNPSALPALTFTANNDKYGYLRESARHAIDKIKP